MTVVRSFLFASAVGFMPFLPFASLDAGAVWQHPEHAVVSRSELVDPPMLEGQLLHFVDSPNRFGLPAHNENHVWAWRDNPNGVFVDWNPHVSCEGQ